VEPPVRGRNSVVAGYQLVTASGSIVATVQVRPAAGATSLLPQLDIGRGDADAIAAAALAHSIAEVRRFYPEAQADAEREVLVVHDGVLRSGRGSAVEYRVSTDDVPQAMRMEVSVLCCTRRRELVEYRFRHAASLEVGRETSEFLRAFPWSAEEAAR
jgi:hypothetical protein